jgi:tetratricopeptide (TPR) repeat protein
MRTIVRTLALVSALGGAVAAQGTGAPTLEAQRANQHYKEGWSQIRAGAWDAAVREFRQAIDGDPKFALAYYSLGRAYMGRRDFGEAITAYSKARDLFVNSGSEQFSNQVEQRQRITDRIFQYQTALNEARARSTAASINAQSQSLYVRDLQAKITQLEQIRDRNTTAFTMDTTVPYYVPMALGAAYFRSGRFADAEREYKEAIAANGQSGETHNNLAVLYLTTGRYADADSEVRAAEKVGFRVNENLKGDIRKALKAGGA